MSNYIEWSDLFSVSIGKIDHQHKDLVQILNDFHGAFVSGAGTGHAFATLNRLVKYAEDHFSNEETLMEEVHYPGLIKHKLEHERLLKEIFELEEKLEKKERELDSELFEFIKNWLLHHILEFDKQLEAHFKTNKLPPEWD